MEELLGQGEYAHTAMPRTNRCPGRRGEGSGNKYDSCCTEMSPLEERANQSAGRTEHFILFFWDPQSQDESTKPSIFTTHITGHPYSGMRLEGQGETANLKALLSHGTCEQALKIVSHSGTYSPLSLDHHPSSIDLQCHMCIYMGTHMCAHTQAL